MKAAILTGAIFFSGAAAAQDRQDCRVLVGKEWIQMGTTTLAGCLNFADEAATPGERQYAKLGGTFLKVQGNEHFESGDGGNTWQPIAMAAPAGGFQSLNVLEPPQGEAAVTSGAAAPKPPINKKRRYRYHR